MAMLSLTEQQRADTIESLIREHSDKVFRFTYTKDNGEKSWRVGTFETFRGNTVVMATDKGYRSFHLYGIDQLSWEG